MVADGTSGTPKHTAQQRKCSEMTQQNPSSNLDPRATMGKIKKSMCQTRGLQDKWKYNEYER